MARSAQPRLQELLVYVPREDEVGHKAGVDTSEVSYFTPATVAAWCKARDVFYHSKHSSRGFESRSYV